MAKENKEYTYGFNDGIYHATDFMKSVAKDLQDFEEGASDSHVLLEIADVLLEDIQDVEDD